MALTSLGAEPDAERSGRSAELELGHFPHTAFDLPCDIIVVARASLLSVLPVLSVLSVLFVFCFHNSVF